MDKVQKIREEVVRLKSQLLIGACSSQIAMETRCKEEAYDEVLTLLDSLQEEPKKCMYAQPNYTNGDRLVLCDGCEEECKYAQKEADWLQELHYKIDSLSKEDFEKVWAKYAQEEESVSEDLWEAAQIYYEELQKEKFEGSDVIDAFYAGAQWQQHRDNIPQELVEAYWNAVKTGVKGTCDVINAINWFNKPVSEDLNTELDKYIKEHFTIDKEQLDRFGLEEKDYMYSMDKSDMLILIHHFANWQFERVNEALLSEVLPCFMHGGEADEVVAKLEEVLNKKK